LQKARAVANQPPHAAAVEVDLMSGAGSGEDSDHQEELAAAAGEIDI